MTDYLDLMAKALHEAHDASNDPAACGPWPECRTPDLWREAARRSAEPSRGPWGLPVFPTGSSRTSEMWPEITPENKFHQGNGDDGKHYWLTPPDLYAQLDAEFHFDFDPCPYPLPDGFDGLTCEWGQSNYVNPPFGSIIHDGKKKGPTAWVRKAIEEHRKGKTVVFVYPIDKWILMLLLESGPRWDVRNLGDVRWHAIEDGTPGKGTGRHIACFVLRGDA